MKKILILSLILLPFGLQAEQQVPLTIFNMQASPVNRKKLKEQFAEICQILAHRYNPPLYKDLIEEVKVVNRDLSAQQDDLILKAYRYLLRRYRVFLATPHKKEVYQTARTRLLQDRTLVAQFLRVLKQSPITNEDDLLFIKKSKNSFICEEFAHHERKLMNAEFSKQNPHLKRFLKALAVISLMTASGFALFLLDDYIKSMIRYNNELRRNRWR